MSALRRRAAAIAAMALVAAIAPTTSPAAADDGGRGSPLSDAPLLASIQQAGGPSVRVPVEIHSSDPAGAGRAAQALGGIVTGMVPGELVQVSMPAGQVGALAAADSSITQLKRPRRINRIEDAQGGLGRVQLGAVLGENATATNAVAWQAAGITGAGVKVGIVDFFDLGLWNMPEDGPVPDAAHQFCLDTSGEVPADCPMPTKGTALGTGLEHGVAVAESIKDIAPGAELYLATVATTADLQAAVDWFAANGVSIITRSLGSPFDGPGDGTGPLDTIVDHAADRGITWFNSAGNSALGAYGRFSDGLVAGGWVDFQPGPGVNTALTLGSCVGLEGIRWSDWGKPADQITRYEVTIESDNYPPQVFDQVADGPGAPPLMLDGLGDSGCKALNPRLKMRRIAGPTVPADTIEVGLFDGELAPDHASAAYSAAMPAVDSANPALVAVGAVDPPMGSTIAGYSSQGPTNDGRIKPDVSAPSCYASTIYSPTHFGPGACFNGTSAASPTAAGVAALLLGRGLAVPGAPLASLVRHLVRDLGAPGADNVYGAGEVLLPAPPTTTVDARPARYVPAASPQRILDTRPISPTAGAPIGPFAQRTIVDLPIPAMPGGGAVSAVAVTITSVDAKAGNYIQALPTLIGQVGGFANLNVATAGQIKPNFAIVPVGVGGSISLYLPTGGNVVVDLAGWFTPAATAASTAGRFVALTPVRALDTRPDTAGPVPAGWTPHRPAAGETVVVPTPAGVPADAQALVLNITATDATAPGFLRAQPTGASGLTTANGNYVPGTDAGTMSIVPVGADGTVSVFTNAATHIVADVTGYITGATSPASNAGLFVPLTPQRQYDSRLGAFGGVHVGGSTRLVTFGVPATASAVAVNFATDQETSPGYLTAFPADGGLPLVSNLNFPQGTPISNAGLVGVSSGARLGVLVNRTTHVIIDVNGYFTGTT